MHGTMETTDPARNDANKSEQNYSPTGGLVYKLIAFFQHFTKYSSWKTLDPHVPVIGSIM